LLPLTERWADLVNQPLTVNLGNQTVHEQLPAGILVTGAALVSKSMAERFQLGAEVHICVAARASATNRNRIDGSPVGRGRHADIRNALAVDEMIERSDQRSPPTITNAGQFISARKIDRVASTRCQHRDARHLCNPCGGPPLDRRQAARNVVSTT
jgi:hypothetical protein